MRIVVIDKNMKRNSDHRRDLKANYNTLARRVYKKLKEKELQNFRDDILLIHYNNKEEADFLHASKNIGRIRVFFSGEWDGYKIRKDGDDYLVGHNKLYSKDMVDKVMSSI
jgi:hypothetical protein